MILAAAAALFGVLTLARGDAGQQPPASTPPAASLGQAIEASPAPPPQAVELFDVFDLLRKIRHKEQTKEQRAEANDPSRRMYAFAPVVGYKPSSGVLVGVAGNVAFFRGDPTTTHISSAVAALNVSTLEQVSATAKLGVFMRDDRWKIEGDNRFQWTSQDTFGLGTDTVEAAKVNMKFDYFRVYETAFRTLRPGVFAGAGFHYSDHTDVRPGKDAEAAWDASPYVAYSEEHGFPLASQTSAGASVNFLVDTRDNAINADRGWFGSASYRAFFEGFLGGDSTWQQLNLDLRTYRALSRDTRHKLAFWLYADMVVGGTAPYMDLPATGMDTYGRSGRGYSEGRFRGERLLYGEIEYRGTLMRNGLLGMVAFLNTATFSNSQTGEQLFDAFAPAGGVGLRLLMNKRSRTNICVDFGWGKQGSSGLYLAVQEAF